ncbi:MAG: LPS export ABC transporter periplasmic protein LptC [Prolixibacteraceae bacterium]
MIRRHFILGIFPFGRSGNVIAGRMGIMLPVILLFFSCQTKVAADLAPELLKNTSIPTLEALNFETFYTDSGVVRYHLQTPKLLIFDDAKQRYKDFPEGFLVQKYDLNRKIISQMSGNHGKYFDLEKKWEANGNVVLVNSQGDTLRSEELKYHETEDLIFSDQFVSIKKGDQYITGTGGFKSDAQMTKWSFIKTKGHIYVEGK